MPLISRMGDNLCNETGKMTIPYLIRLQTVSAYLSNLLSSSAT